MYAAQSQLKTMVPKNILAFHGIDQFVFLDRTQYSVFRELSGYMQ